MRTRLRTSQAALARSNRAIPPRCCAWATRDLRLVMVSIGMSRTPPRIQGVIPVPMDEELRPGVNARVGFGRWAAVVMPAVAERQRARAMSMSGW